VLVSAFLRMAGFIFLLAAIGVLIYFLVTGL
jgi:hypothetical protein